VGFGRDMEKGSGKAGGGVPQTVAYTEFLEDLRSRIRTARMRATLSVHRELLQLYWDIGREIVRRQESEGWGSSVIQQISADLKKSFPAVRGFSESNIWRMRAFFLAYQGSGGILAQPARESDGRPMPVTIPDLPWGHQITLFERVKEPDERAWYGQMAMGEGWSRSVLSHQIESGLFDRHGQAITNFDSSLPGHQSDLAKELFKDPYHFDFLELSADAEERDLETALLGHLRDFLLELGVGFALVGSQYGLEVGGQEYRLDLLFYHVRLRCFVAVELKVGSFKPEHAGKMNFYLASLDDQLRRDEDQPSIGLILCKDRNRVVVEYALRGSNRPIGVAEYRLTKRLPQELRGSLPTPEELRRGLKEDD
jgi:predicted nuclease of restriction endonuclease-like (RecB) superfamily